MQTLRLTPILAGSLLATTAFAQGFQPTAAPQGIQGVPVVDSYLGCGIGTFDIDNDGDLDVVIAGDVGSQFRLFRNDGGMQFTDISLGCGLGVCQEVKCVSAADIDNDGNVDLFVGNNFSLSQIFMNQGGGIFIEQGAMRGMANVESNFTACFGDYDRDGWLDLYIGNRQDSVAVFTGTNRLYRNTGNGFFTDVTASSGTGSTRMALVSTWMDYDEDGWPDLLVLNDKALQWGGNEVYRNNSDGTFTAVQAQIGANWTIDGMGVDYTDAFNDGGIDFFCTDLPIDHLFQVWNPTTSSYDNATATYGVFGSGVGWSCKFLDYDNDGWQDLHIVQLTAPNYFYRNPGAAAAANVPWPNVAPALGTDHFFWQFTNAMGDFDNDGRVDILERFDTGPFVSPEGVVLMRNTVAGGNWLKFKTRGTVSNRDGYGTRVEVTTNTLHQRQWVRSGTGYVSHHDTRLNFGLGTDTVADVVRVTWPLGQVQYLTNVAANQILELVEPELKLSAPASVGGTTTLDMSIPGDEGLSYLMVLSLSSVPTVLPGGIVLPIQIDGLTSISMIPGNPILPGAAGILTATGQATSTLTIPPLPWLAGLTFYATGMTADMPTFPILRTTFPSALPITIQ
ncbi:MAG: hypothetical protein ACI89X_004643 [Planctomycetota bacterium]|jgi:hypothetical protein